MVLPHTETQVWLALSDAAHDVITSPVMPIIDPGAIVDGEPPYILLSDVRNDKERWGVAGQTGQSGTLMLTVHWPLSVPVTHTQLMEIGGQIAGHFPSDRCMRYGGTGLRVIRDSDVLAPFVDGAFRVVPVRVYWVLT